MKSISAVINARKGSTRVSNKLLRPFADTSLIELALSKLNKMNFFNKLDVTEFIQRKMKTEHTLGIRPEHLVLCDDIDAWVSGKLELVENLGEYVLVHLIGSKGKTFIAKMDRHLVGSTGENLTFKVFSKNAHWFDSASKKRLNLQFKDAVL